MNNLYKIEVGYFVALDNKEEKVHSQDVEELWDKRLCHLNHGALKIVHQIGTSLP